MGKVPAPKAAIKKTPFKTLPVAAAPAIPMYTKPQGNKPFNIPIRKKEERLPFKKSLLKLFLIVKKTELFCSDPLKENKTLTNKIQPTPTDNTCCNPAKTKVCPTTPANRPNEA